MKLTVHINMTGGLAYQNRILGVDLHVNGTQHADLELPLSGEAFKTLKNALRAKRLICYADVEALQAEAVKAAGGAVPEAEMPVAKSRRQETIEALNALLEQDAAQQEEIHEDAPSEEIPAEEAPAEEAPAEESPAEETPAEAEKKPSKKRK